MRRFFKQVKSSLGSTCVPSNALETVAMDNFTSNRSIMSWWTFQLPMLDCHKAHASTVSRQIPFISSSIWAGVKVVKPTTTSASHTHKMFASSWTSQDVWVEMYVQYTHALIQCLSYILHILNVICTGSDVSEA